MRQNPFIPAAALLLAWLSTLPAQPADSVAVKLVPGSASLTLAEIDQSLQAHPPAWEHADVRTSIAAALDQQITVQVRDEMTDEDRTQLQPLLQFHEYELMHDHGGNRTSPWLTGAGRKVFDQHRSMPLFWGEHFLLTRDLVVLGR